MQRLDRPGGLRLGIGAKLSSDLSPFDPCCEVPSGGPDLSHVRETLSHLGETGGGSPTVGADACFVPGGYSKSNAAWIACVSACSW